MLLEPQDLFAHQREAEVARLDDASVYRADRNLVYAIAFDAHEGIVGGQNTVAGASGAAAALQGSPPRSPKTMVKPRPLVGAALRAQA